MESKNGKHHYLPQFYLKGFLDEDNRKLYSYNKQYKRIREFTPAGIYYEKGLNDLDFGETGFLNIEDTFFKEKDNIYSQAFNTMKSTYNYDVHSMPLQVKADIVEFVMGLYWRVPGCWQRLIDLIDNEGLLTSDLELLGIETTKVSIDKIIPHIIEDVKRDIRNQKVFMTLCYGENAVKHDWKSLNEKFHIFETNEPMLIGDIPYVPLKAENKRGKIMEEFMIPLDKNHVLIYSKKCPAFLEIDLLHYFFLCIIDGASNKISCGNYNYLENKIKEMKPIIQRYKEMGLNSLKEQLLVPLMEFESRFETFDDFYNYYRKHDMGKSITPEKIEICQNYIVHKL